MTLTADWEGRQGDTAKPVIFQLSDADGPVNISTLTGRFHMAKKPGAVAVIDAAIQVDDDGTPELRGMGRWQPQDGDTDALLGWYYAEVEMDTPDGPQTFPDGRTDDKKADDYIMLYFSRQLA